VCAEGSDDIDVKNFVALIAAKREFLPDQRNDRQVIFVRHGPKRVESRFARLLQAILNRPAGELSDHGQVVTPLETCEASEAVVNVAVAVLNLLGKRIPMG